MFDLRYQYALHTTSFPEQTSSKNSLTNFRAAVYRYNQKYGCDLIQEEIESQAKTFSKLLKIEGKTVRIDSPAVSSSCRELSRLEIIYSTIVRLMKVVDKNTTLLEYFKPYQDEIHYNDTIYPTRDDNNRMIEGYDLQKNTYSDQKFASTCKTRELRSLLNSPG